MAIVIEPLKAELWPAFEELFGKQGACYGCWCTHFRLAPAVRRGIGVGQKKNLIRERILAGPPPGLLAFEDEKPVGWMQIGPRHDVPQWNNAKRSSAPLQQSEALDDRAWAISCFFVRGEARGKGLSHALVRAGIDFAGRNGALVLDACPMDHSTDTSRMALFVGPTRVFEKAGFLQVASRKPGRPLMRYCFGSGAQVD